MNKLKYKRVRTAYLVASTNSELWEYGHPDNSCQLVYAVNPAQAKSKYKAFNYIRDVKIELVSKRYPKEDMYTFENKVLTTEEIDRELRYREWLKEMKELVDNNPSAKVYIWSGQWGAYWCPNYCGYTSYKDKAGIYDIKDAWDHVSHVGIEKAISFKLIK